MSRKKLGALELSHEQPTALTFKDLRNWVLWQFPIPRGGWLCGAANPADPDDDDWIPARIQPHQQRVVLYAHCAPALKTPEEAAEWMADYEES